MPIWIKVTEASELSYAQTRDWANDLIRERALELVFPAVSPEFLSNYFMSQLLSWKDLNIWMVAGETARYGVFYLHGHCGRMAHLGFAFLPAGKPMAEKIGRYVLDLIWSWGHTSLAGMVAEYNFPALAYAKRLGGREMGRWPGAIERAGSSKLYTGVLFQFLPPASPEAEAKEEPWVA